MDITEEKQNQERSRELFEKEMAYFAELSSSEKNFRGRMNVTKNCVESYVSALDDAITHVGATFEETVQNMAQSAVDWQYGEKISSALTERKCWLTTVRERWITNLNF